MNDDDGGKKLVGRLIMDMVNMLLFKCTTTMVNTAEKRKSVYYTTRVDMNWWPVEGSW